MATKNIKFKISIKELSVEFEGDVQMADRFQQQVTGAINSLASVQNRLLPSGQPPQDRVIDVSPSLTRRRRRARTARNADSGDGASQADAVTTGDPDDATPSRQAARRSSTSGARELIMVLRNAAFFTTHRPIADIRTELQKRGHSFKSNELSPTLQRLTREQVLKRDKDESDHWAYYVD